MGGETRRIVLNRWKIFLSAWHPQMHGWHRNGDIVVHGSRETSSASSAACHKAPIQLMLHVSSLGGLHEAVEEQVANICLDHAAALDANASFALVADAFRHAHDRDAKVAVSFCNLPNDATWQSYRAMLDSVVGAGADALLLDDQALCLYAAAHHPSVPRHFRTTASASSAPVIERLRLQLGAARIVLPRLSSIGQIADLRAASTAELQVFAFGPACRIIGDRSATNCMAPSSMPKNQSSGMMAERCADDMHAANEDVYTTGGHVNLSALHLLPQLINLGVAAISVETGYPGAPTVPQIHQVWREAIDVCSMAPESYVIRRHWLEQLGLLDSKDPGKRAAG